MRQTVTILSVYFRPVTAWRPYKPFDNSRGYSSTFKIDGCAKGEQKTLTIGNHFERTYIGEKRYMDTPIYCDGLDGLGVDLVHEWAENCLGADKGGPGILVCAGDTPTQEEVDRCMARQTQWADHLCLLAEVEWLNGHKTNVQDIHREAAIWLGRGADYEWVSDKGTARMAVCPMCSKTIDARAVICPHCNSVVDFDRYQQYMDRLEKLKAKMAEANLPVPPAPIAPPVRNPQQQKTA